MQELERCWRILQWNSLEQSNFEETAEVATQCRTAWMQLCAILPANSELPNEFRHTFLAFNEGNAMVQEMFADERRLILCISDLRDYLLIMRLRTARKVKSGV